MSHRTYQGDPRWIQARYAAPCGACGAAIPRGARAYYWPSTRTLHCKGCGEDSERRFHAEAEDEDFLAGYR